MSDALQQDCSLELAATIAEAGAAGRPLYICGGNSKRQILGRDCTATALDVSTHCGITDYQPSELVLTARGGTPLADIQTALAKEGQVLPFEPALFDGKATLGGTVACNLSGPARPWAGSVRDLILGVQLIDGAGQLLCFGGKVMKNVAGYDVSRLQAGALGTLGVLSEISLKVLPGYRHSTTLCYETDATAAIATMNKRAGQPAPLSAACWLDGRLYLRLSGDQQAVDSTARNWGGEQFTEATEFWSNLREMNLPFFTGDQPLWRLSVKSTSALSSGEQPTLIDWCGAQRWLRGNFELEALQQQAAVAGGNITLFRGGDRCAAVLPAPDPVSRRLQQRLKQTFDPQGILNPGRLHAWL